MLRRSRSATTMVYDAVEFHIGCACSLPAGAQCTLEIATVAGLKGTWSDRAAGPRAVNSVICENNRLERVKDANASADDFISLRLRSDAAQVVTFTCKVLLGCERPLDLGPIAREARRRLKGNAVLESFTAWRSSRHRNGSTLSRTGTRLDDAVLVGAAVLESGQPLRTDIVFRPEAAPGAYHLDLCATVGSDRECGLEPDAVRHLEPAQPTALPSCEPLRRPWPFYRLKSDISSAHH